MLRYWYYQPDSLGEKTLSYMMLYTSPVSNAPLSPFSVSEDLKAAASSVITLGVILHFQHFSSCGQLF
jgi:hypothetical protein